MAKRLRAVIRAKLQRVVEDAVRNVVVGEREHARRAIAEETAALRAELAALGDQVRAEVARILEELRATEIRDRRDLIAAAERLAVSSSARLTQSMTSARQFPYPDQTLKYALSIAPQDGMALEFGVYKGSTLRTIAEARGGHEVYGFDSFEGLPEDWRAGFQTGTFDDLDGGLPDVPGAKLVVGWFNETLPEFMTDHSGEVAFLHVDGDLYSSAVTVFEHVGPRLRAGSVIVFDEFFNYPGWEDGEYRAWQEFVARTGWDYVYEAYTLDNEQVVVRLT